MKVEIWSDVVCPWCYVGKRRFDEALEQFDGEVEVEYRAFELDPAVPEEGQPLNEYLGRKFGGTAAVDRVHRRLAEVGSELGIDFRWEGKLRVNTFAAHQLLAWALDTAGPAAQRRLKERLLRAYFTDNLDVGDHEVLAGLAEEVGLERDGASEATADGRYAERVRADERRARESEIQAVPTFVLDGRFAIPGAQDTETFLRLLQRAEEMADAAEPG